MKFNYTIKIWTNDEWVITHEYLSFDEMTKQLKYLCEERGEKVMVIPYAIEE